MEVTAAITSSAIVGIGTWAARDVVEKYEKRELNKDRLGKWHEYIFSNQNKNKAEKKVKVWGPKLISIFRMPSFEDLETLSGSINAKSWNRTPLGAVCWRGLIAKYAPEQDAIKAFKGSKYFIVKDQVGAFRGNVAALVNVADMYKIMFSNMEPGRWKEVSLNKVERVATIVGDFSMIYYDNTKWFHFVPNYNNVKPGKYSAELKNLLRDGHNLNLESFEFEDHLKIDGDLIGCWPVSEKKGEWSDKFRTEVMKHVDLAVKGNPKSVFSGGVVTKSKEYEVCRYLANIILVTFHEALNNLPGSGTMSKSSASLEEWELPLNNIRDSLLKKGTIMQEKEIEKIETMFFTGESVDDIGIMASACTKILVSPLHSANKRHAEKVLYMKQMYPVIKALKNFQERLAVLMWNADDLNMLEQEAWLAGVDDTVTGDESSSKEANTKKSAQKKKSDSSYENTSGIQNESSYSFDK